MTTNARALIDGATLQQVCELLGCLSALTKNFQIYGLAHPRTQSNLEDFTARCGSLRQQPGIEELLTVAYHDGRFFLEHVPLQVSRQQGFLLVTHLEANRMGGFRLSLELRPRQIEQVLRLLAVQPGSRASGAARRVPGFEWLHPEEVHRLESAASRGFLNLHMILQLPELRIEEDVYLRTLGTLASFMQECADAEIADLESIRSASDELVDHFTRDADRIMPLTTIPYAENFIYHHSLNVALLTLKAASLVISDLEQLRRIGQAALLHDLGKTAIPPEILFKPSKLTRAEAEIVMRHPVIGARRLAEFPDADPLATAVAFGHHIKDGGQGYPKVSPSFRLGPITALVEVADIYEALTAQRPYKKAMTASEAFGTLYAMPNMKSFRSHVDLLLRAIGLQPVGSRVRDGAGTRGVVVGHDDADPRRPVVRGVHSEAGGRYRLDPAQVRRGLSRRSEALAEDAVTSLDSDEDVSLYA